MQIDLSKWPLLTLMEHLQHWVKSAQSRGFWQAIAEHELWAGELRDEAKDVIVWLELNGQEAATARLDETMEHFRRAVWKFQHACEGTYPPEDPQCRDLQEAMIRPAEIVAGAAEDLHDEVPEDVWKGFFGE